MSKRDSNNKVLVGITCVLAAIIVAGGAYFLFFQKKDEGQEKKEESNISAPVVPDITDDKNAETSKKDTALGSLECVKDQTADYCKIDNSKILNARSGVTYTLTELSENDSMASDFDKLATITLSEDLKEAKIKLNNEIIKQYYDKNGYTFEITITMTREIAATKVAGFGQAVGDEYIFFIMKDGSVYYLQVADMLKTRKFDPQRVKNVEKIVNILGGNSYTELSGGHTNFAVRSDGKAYDLQTLLPSWGAEN